MKESDFIRQNKKNWQEFEEAVSGEDKDPSRTSKLFTQVTDDLSYARSFYSNRSVRLYLNGVARVLFTDLNKSRKKGWKDFISFWKKDLPLTIYNSRRAMLISLLVFICSFSIGIVTSQHDKSFASRILGARYVAMTEENIKNGDPMAVYKSEEELRTFLPILLNNLKVDFVTFFSGLFMAIGSLVVMIGNGVMVGVFQYFFIERGLFWESFLGIWTHGSLEIPTIILSGGAGLTLGRGLLFPGTYSRLQSFKVSARKGLIIILGVTPLTFIAALVEGFLTRHTGIPDPLRLTFIILSFSGVLAYYFFYPRRVGQRALLQPEEDHTLLYKKTDPFDTTEIHSAGHLISETFHQLFENFSSFGKILFSLCTGAALLVAWNPLTLFRDPDSTSFGAEDLTRFNEYPALAVVLLIITIFCSAWPALYLRDKLSPGKSADRNLRSLFKGLVFAFIGTSLLEGLFFAEIDLAMFIAIVLLPLMIFFTTVSTFISSVRDTPGKAFSLIAQAPGKLILSVLLFSVLSLAIYLGCQRALDLVFLSDAISWMLTDDDVMAEKIRMGFFAFQTVLSVGLYLLLSCISSVLLYFTLHETATAEGLLKKIWSV